jgi:phage anti-repressor protein
MNELIPLEKIAPVIKSESRFPVDFDDAWQWIGYSSKQKALESLYKNFKAGTDFLATRKLNPTVEFAEAQPESGESKHAGGRGKSDKYSLAIDCFKAFCMMAGTEKGKAVRRYYIDLEKRFYLTQAEKLESTYRRSGITYQWQRQGVTEGWQFGKLTKTEYHALFGTEDIRKPKLDREQTLKLAAFEAVETWKHSQIPDYFLGFEGCKKSIRETASMIDQVKRPVLLGAR